MHRHDALYDRVVSWQRRITAGFFALALGTFILLGLVTIDARQSAWDRAGTDAQNLATALSRDLGHTLSGLDQTLRAAQAELSRRAFANLDEQARQHLLFDRSVTDNHLAAMLLLDRNGISIAGSGSVAENIRDFSDRTYFTAQRDNPDLGLYVSGPFMSRADGAYAIALSRRIDDPNGSLAGVVVATIRYRYFEHIVSNLNLGPGGSVVVTATDGTLIYGSKAKPETIGRKFPNAQLFEQLRRGDRAAFVGPSRLDGTLKLHAFEAVDGFPMIVLVNTPMAQVYSEWRLKAIMSWCIYLALFTSAYGFLHTSRLALHRHKVTSALLKQTTNIFQAYFANAPDALFLVDVRLDGSFAYVEFNPACETMTGLPNATVKGKAPVDLFPPALAASLEWRYRACVELGRAYAYSLERDLAGASRDLHTILAPVTDPSGRIVMLIGSIRDMTVENRALAERGQTKKMEALGRLTAGIAHDFNNHLQTIGSSLELLEAEYLNGSSDARDIVAEAVVAAASGAKLTQRLLAFSRQQVLRPERVCLAHALAGVSRTGRGVDEIQFKLAVEAFTGDAVVDPAQFEACLTNLLANARDATSEGGRVVLHARDAGPSDTRFGLVTAGNYVVVAVQDSGIGMNEEVFEHAFDPFFTTKAFGSGAGLGLSMVQGVCQQSGGDARILRATAGGTRVELWLPRGPVNMRAIEDCAALNRARFGKSTGRALLVLRDEHLVRQIAPPMVAAGFEIVAVDSLHQGLLRLCDRDCYDVALIDCADEDQADGFAHRAPGLQPSLVVVRITARAAASAEALVDDVRDRIAIARVGQAISA